MTGWLVSAWLGVVVIRLRRRLELVARAEHELRGPLTAFGLALDASRGTVAGRRLARVLDAELARARAGLADLAAARGGGRAAASVRPVALERLVRSSAAAWGHAGPGRIGVSWEAGAVAVWADRSRVAQAVGNLLANAVEHGAGPVAVRGRRVGRRVRVEVVNAVRPGGERRAHRPGRGHGLSIAAAASATAGGSLSASIAGDRALAAIELPVVDP